MKKIKIFSLALRVVAALIMLQTLYFKFTAQPESVYIFTTVGMEPWGRIATGVAELIASLLLLVPATVALGAMMGGGIMLGALTSHLFILGIDVQGDGGVLFMYAVIVSAACAGLLYIHRDQIVAYKRALFGERVKHPRF